MITVLTDPASFGLGEVTIEGDTYRHLFRARRVAAGEPLRVVDGEGRARWGAITRVDRATAAVSLGEAVAANEPGLALALLVPTCRPETAAWLVEKGTEVGVSSFHFLNMARAPRDLGSGALHRLRRVAASAVEQCHRARVPVVTGPHGFQEATRLAGGGLRWFLDVGADAQPSPGDLMEPAAASLLVGPEGGLAPEERAELLASGWRRAGLGERTLRLETAAVVGAAFLLLPKLTLPAPSG